MIAETLTSGAPMLNASTLDVPDVRTSRRTR
jgi:hypothetical protein